MTIDEAIIMLGELKDLYPKYIFKQFLPPVDLGIEALKRFKEISVWPHEYLRGPLPGETEK